MVLVRKARAWLQYRRMARRLAELDRLDKKARASNQRRPTPRRPLSKGEMLFLLLVGTAISLIIGIAQLYPNLFDISSEAEDDPLTGTPGTTGSYVFLNTTPKGRPVSYNSCEPIHYVINPAGMPEDGERLITEAIGVISEASGLEFVYDSRSDERPSKDRQISQPQRYGRGHAPVLIAWADQAELDSTGPTTGSDTKGHAGSTFLSPRGPESARYVTGQVVLARDGLSETMARPNGYLQARAIVLHELGHLLGLDHVADSNELMAPVNIGQTELGPGDREGLAILGSGPCWS